jgi:putative membrane protein
MYTAKNVKFRIIFHFAWKTILFFFLYSLFYCVLHQWLGYTFIGIPFLPIGVIGTAVAFYLGFKNNSSYERLWEARRIWGNIVNLSRTFGAFVLTYIESPERQQNDSRISGVRKALIYRHLAYVNALRIRLRSRGTWAANDRASEAIVEKSTSFRNDTTYNELATFLTAEELRSALGYANPVTHILKEQAKQFTTLKQQGFMDDFRHMEFGKIVTELYAQQGACERIKTFPFPRQYAFFSKVFVWIFILVLPLGLLAEFSKLGDGFAWLTIPFYVIIAWVFNTMEIVGDTSENPFDNGINDIPMTAICRTIEIDLREMLNDEQIPKAVTPVNDILM